jgi:16S rRNA (cytidine1402-2'-O)-methyltransferase
MRRNHPPARAKTMQAAAAGQRSLQIGGQPYHAPVLAPGLYLVATPIGNLRDITLRALEVLAGAELIACEDTRVTKTLLDHFGIETPMTAYHEHNAAAARPRLLARLADGAAVALVSDAGTPLVSDPGFKLVREARASGCPVVAVPGASAVLAALVGSGMPTDRFFFEGFLPAKPGARRHRIAEISHIPATLVLFESGPRLAATLADLEALLGPRPASVCRELTKLHEEVRSGNLAGLAQDYADAPVPRGEIVIVVGPPEQKPVDPLDVDDLLRTALRRTSLKEAVGEVAAATGHARRAVYQRALAIAGENDEARR